MPSETPDILARIVARKWEELRSATVPVEKWKAEAEVRRGDRRPFREALRRAQPAIISEIKQASPSRGVLVEDFRPAELARRYEQGGAAALSVLTDRTFFQGSLDDLRAARSACSLPVLRKDFTLTSYHVWEAAAAGADAILLIAAILDDASLRSLRELAGVCGMAALVEVHDAEELDRAIASGAEIIGVNNRDLRTFQVSLQISIELAGRMPGEVVRVSESGISSGGDIHQLRQAGYDAFLIGEHLVRSGDAASALENLLVVKTS